MRRPAAAAPLRRLRQLLIGCTCVLGAATLIIFLPGGSWELSLLGEEFREELCRAELRSQGPPQHAPPEVEPDLESRLLPVRTVCTWPGGPRVEVRHTTTEEWALDCLRLTLLAGGAALLATLASRRRPRPDNTRAGKRR